MALRVVLTVKMDSHSTAPYKVNKIKNSIEWAIGQRLTKREIDELLHRPAHREVEVIVT